MGPKYWKKCVVETDPCEIEGKLKATTFSSSGGTLELLHFEEGRHAPNILISPGTGASRSLNL